MTRFGYVPVTPGTLISQKQRDALVAPYAPALEALGGERRGVEDLDDAAPLLYFVVTGGTEKAVLDLRGLRRETAPDEPVYLVAHPGNNSLPASLEVLARLQQDGEPGRIFYLRDPDDEAGFERIARAVEDLEVRRVLTKARIGLVGAPSDWLVASTPDAETLSRVWGPEVVPVAMEEVEGALEGVPAERVGASLRSLTEEATEVCEPSPEALEEVVRVYAALADVVERHDLDALTVRCFDLVLHLKTTGCFGLAQLTDEGVIAGCEGDLVTTVGLLWAHELLDVIPWMANPAQLDEEENTLWLAHCTVPRRMVTDYRLRSHFESGEGVGIQGTLPPGPVTLLRIGGTGMDQLWLAEGEILQAGEAENLCRTQAQVRLSTGNVTDLLEAPLGNHLVLVPGHHAARLWDWWTTYVKG
jgi:L-fucose isomerase-like protein